MANFGAKYPCFAPFKGVEPTNALPKYDAKVVVGKLVSANLTVNLASGTIAMETDDMLDDVAAVVYGATAAEKKVTYNKGDTAPYGGLGYFKTLMRDGAKYYKGYFYPKVRAALGNDNAQTRGSSITFGTSNTTFTVFAPNTGDWRITETFDSEAEARAWVDEQLAPEAVTPGS